ncbi:Protein of unknown function [Propionibacterium freudenreichii]|uniref:Uncharacterized protein n=1 Tax=Propionibacterium freudenreichii subsp. freudenreichii TaxID=66712 RepID=A0A0B7NST9_PROFF|nr:Protein of unknown function [Propionibacterium freudenreichii]CEP25751.1 Protein of unknown function [Propionibacterium freudenreichii subsp. freudenreichii]CEG91393.1 Protein of unknown function [Propionibacterium freudenreichii]CEG93640.1 Protein of unknown function [Propionibacterium freudenreichii]CEG96093.1 Protein of unknown function [Propionibacterium freudenreichii]
MIWRDVMWVDGLGSDV